MEPEIHEFKLMLFVKSLYCTQHESQILSYLEIEIDACYHDDFKSTFEEDSFSHIYWETNFIADQTLAK